MKILKIDRETTTIQLSLDELKIFKNALNEVYNFLPKTQIDLRLEINSEQVTLLINYIDQTLNIINNQAIQSEIKITINEMRALKNSLNEVCHGIKLVNFEEKIGFNRETVKILLDKVWLGLREVLKYSHNYPKKPENSN